MNDNWVNAMGAMTYGIYVLTSAHEGRMNAMIASWVAQASYDPPLILAAIHPNRYSHELIEKSQHFALHVMRKDQKDVMAKFMGSDPEEKLVGIDWRTGKTGCPLINDSQAWFECRIHTELQPGNHTLFIGEVVDAAVSSTDVPLTTLDYRGQYIGKM